VGALGPTWQLLHTAVADLPEKPTVLVPALYAWADAEAAATKMKARARV
jgi:hypothetical protein